MKNFGKLLFGAIVFYGVYKAFQKSQLKEYAVFSFEGIGIIDNQLRIKLGLYNPTAGSITINSIAGVLTSKGNDIANVSTFDVVKVLPNNKTFINLNVRPSLLGLFTTVKQLVKNKDLRNLSLAFKGAANVNGVSVPVDIKYSV